jgi:hypothetical protein
MPIDWFMCGARRAAKKRREEQKKNGLTEVSPQESKGSLDAKVDDGQTNAQKRIVF